MIFQWLVEKLLLLTFLFMNWQITVQQKRFIYFSLDLWIVPYPSKGSEINNNNNNNNNNDNNNKVLGAHLKNPMRLHHY